MIRPEPLPTRYLISLSLRNAELSDLCAVLSSVCHFWMRFKNISAEVCTVCITSLDEEWKTLVAK